MRVCVLLFAGSGSFLAVVLLLLVVGVVCLVCSVLFCESCCRCCAVLLLCVFWFEFVVFVSLRVMCCVLFFSVDECCFVVVVFVFVVVCVVFVFVCVCCCLHVFHMGGLCCCC